MVAPLPESASQSPEAGPQLSLTTQVMRFVVTGGLAGIVDFGLYATLYKVVGMQVDVSKAISFIVGTITAYLINRRWTFQAAPEHRQVRRGDGPLRHHLRRAGRAQPPVPGVFGATGAGRSRSRS